MLTAAAIINAGSVETGDKVPLYTDLTSAVKYQYRKQAGHQHNKFNPEIIVRRI